MARLPAVPFWPGRLIVPAALMARFPAVMLTLEVEVTLPPVISESVLPVIVMFAETVMVPAPLEPTRTALWPLNSASSAFETPRLVAESAPPRSMVFDAVFGRISAYPVLANALVEAPVYLSPS